MDYYGYRQSHGVNNNYQPKHDRDADSAFKNSSYDEKKSFKYDTILDLHHWVDGFREVIDKYSNEKYLYEKEKELKIQNEADRNEMKLIVSDDKGYLEDIRKALDWYVDSFGEETVYQKLIKDFSIELNRLKKLKKYLSYRVRSLAGKGLYNEPSKEILQYLRIRMDAINILFDSKYDERTPLEIIYGLDKIEEDDDYDIYNGESRNKLFHKYD